MPAEARIKPHYETDEWVLGIGVAVFMHALIAGPFVYRLVVPAPPEKEEIAFVGKPVVAASLLKLGKPIDPKNLPDRYVPKARTAPVKDLTASKEDPAKVHDAGAPPQNVQNSDITSLINKSDPFAEDGGKPRPEEGNAAGVDGGTENVARAGDVYAALLQKFFADNWQIPTVISQGEANRLCVAFQINISPRMVVWHVQTEPVRKSGNDLFDDSARTMLLKLLDDHKPLPMPPPDVAENYKGRTVQIMLSGDTHGGGGRCR